MRNNLILWLLTLLKADTMRDEFGNPSYTVSGKMKNGRFNVVHWCGNGETSWGIALSPEEGNKLADTIRKAANS